VRRDDDTKAGWQNRTPPSQKREKKIHRKEEHDVKIAGFVE
jgi:hypothetical protein